MTTFVLNFILIAGLMFALLSPVKAQQNNPSDSTEIAFLPAIAYNSDLGLIAGGISSVYYFREHHYPFYRYINLSALISTKGMASLQILIDKPQAFNKNIRLTTDIYISRFFQDAYFGIGSDSLITAPPPNLPDFYTFQSFSMGFSSIIRLPIVNPSSYQQLDTQFTLDAQYETPWGNANDRLITRDAPLGVTGGRSVLIGAGLIWEGRNSEFYPTKGNYGAMSISFGNTLWGSSYNLALVSFDVRQYLTFHLVRDVTFASRLSGTLTSGEVPYWKLAYAGDEETIRGYLFRRFLNDNVAILNTELRTWLFSIPHSSVKFGGTLFFDAGHAYPNGTSFNKFISGLKYSAGFGGLGTIFTPDFIIRADFGFSEEGVGIYFTTGLMF